MKKIRLFAISLVCLIMVSISLTAQMQVHNNYGFKIDIPSNWSKNSYMDGTDKVFDYYSPDQTAAIQLRVFEASAEVSTNLLAVVYEETMLPQGTQKLGLDDHTTVNGIPGKQGLYIVNYDGNEVNIANFYTVQNNKGYVLSAIIPTVAIEQSGAKVKQITHSFIIDGFEPAAKVEKQNKRPGGTGGIGGLGGSTTSNVFHIKTITLTDQIDANNNAINPTNNFNTLTPVINAVIDYSGGTTDDMIVSWIYKDYDQVITSDRYNFTDQTGGIGVVSLSKPNNNWPEGNYAVEFKMNGIILNTLDFSINRKVPDRGGLSTTSVDGGGIAGKYTFVGRSDGKVLVNYHYIIVNANGTYSEKYNPKNSGDYVGGTDGTWILNGDNLTMVHPGGTVKDYYKVNGNELTRDASGVVFTFRK
jgi:hypothetical protein